MILLFTDMVDLNQDSHSTSHSKVDKLLALVNNINKTQEHITGETFYINLETRAIIW